MVSETVAIEPIVSWPREAVVGRTYLLTVDLRLAEGAAWPYPEEEYEIGCHLDAGPECDVRVLRQAGVVLHRFGATYGPAEFLLTARAVTGEPRLVLMLVNAWGVPIDHRLLEMSVVAPAEAEPARLETVTVEGRAEARVAAAPRVFISYRRSDTPAAARMLADAFKHRFGEDRVWFDAGSLRLESNWRTAVPAAITEADVTVVVIGPRFVALSDERGSRHVSDLGEEDMVRNEVELALRERVPVIPVLVDGAEMPPVSQLPRPFRPLARLQAATVRHESWDRDVDSLIERIEHLRSTPAEPPRTPALPAATDVSDPDAERIAERLGLGDMVFFLGAGVNSAGRPADAERDRGGPPDANELARELAQRFRIEPERGDLAAIAQQVAMTSGTADLHRALRQALSDATPGPVHRWLAALPRLLRQRGLEGGQLLITLNYDDALERAFDEINEPYDLAVRIADGPEADRFFHAPWWPDEPRLIDRPNAYVGFPIDEEGRLERTVIVKMLGSVSTGRADPRPRGSYVITEDDYIDYLSGGPIAALIPVQILDKVLGSSALFLAGSARDQRLRVLLRRLWRRGSPRARAWAVQREADIYERDSWSALDVNLWEVEPLECFARLEALLINV